MNWKHNRSAWLLASAIGLAVSGSVLASGSTPTLQDALEASPNRLTAQEQRDLERNAASGASALQAPEGVYTPNAASTDGSRSDTTTAASSNGAAGAPLVTEPDAASVQGQGKQHRAVPAETAVPAIPAGAGVIPATPAEPAVPAIPADKAESLDDAGARNDVAPRKRDVPADRKRG